MMKRGINIANHFESTPTPGVEFANPIQILNAYALSDARERVAQC